MPGQRGSNQRQRNRMFTMRLDDAEWVHLKECQSASKKDPLSASKRDPVCRAV
jgi:hypothetical protein